ncbi:MAG: Hpt domain-containing protein [Treponema sp.]|jgi:HPt (histidine-containing phosphotransfer) domain-containing protein|nr:Hpt domain-containing protein [Treponema sp.]
MAELVYVDVEDGKKRVMNNAKLYIRLLTKFKDETRIDPLFAALDEGDYAKAQELAHTIKGVSANLSIKELAAKILELENQIKAKAVQAETVEAVKACFTETMKEVEKVVAENA